MKKLVVVADDFGFSSGVTKGILEGKVKGILTELSMMMWSPGTEEAVKKIKKLSIKQVGIHITLNNLNATGKYMHTEDYTIFLNESSQKVIDDLTLQELTEFEKLIGTKPTHITSHQNIHKHPKLIETIAKYAGKNNIPVRKSNRLGSGTGIETKEEDKNAEIVFKNYKVKTTDYIFSHILGSYDEVKTAFLEDLSMVEDNKTVEIFFHPAYLDAVQLKYSSLLKERERDLKLVKDHNFRSQIKNLNFQFADYSSV